MTDELEDRLPDGLCLSCERRAARGKKYCSECWQWIVAGVAIRRAVYAIRNLPNSNPPASVTQLKPRKRF